MTGGETGYLSGLCGEGASGTYRTRGRVLTRWVFVRIRNDGRSEKVFQEMVTPRETLYDKCKVSIKKRNHGYC